MRLSRRMLALVAAGCSITVVAAAQATGFHGVKPVPGKALGTAVPLMPGGGLKAVAVAQGSTRLDGATSANPHYGYDGDGTMVPAPGDVPSDGHLVEATKTEPDKNTYLVLHGQTGPAQGYDYGSHFLFQGHEAGSPGILTRINLDADPVHRVTLMASRDVHGAPLPPFDGSTWDPFAHRLLLTTEDPDVPGVFQATVGYPSAVRDLDGVLGRGGYEGVQVDPLGRLWLVEDQGGDTGSVNTNAKQPNSFLYRFIPSDPADLTAGGLLQALQVISLRSGDPMVFHDGQADADITSPDVRDLHTYGKVFRTRWVTVHDTAEDGTAPFDANALAKAARATPFKRPENGVFAPGGGFRTFVFTETGDTNADSEAGAALGGYGAVFKLTQQHPDSSRGRLRLVLRGDKQHTGFDNIAFADRTTALVAEDAGDTLHTQRGTFDSLWAVRTTADYGDSDTPRPIRVVYVGRDASATIDSALSEFDGFQNEADNEITGIHVSDGDASVAGLLGVRVPHPFRGMRWRVFLTAQHGDNVTYELIRR
jgi:uncharacterized protein DUF839